MKLSVVLLFAIICALSNARLLFNKNKRGKQDQIAEIYPEQETKTQIDIDIYPNTNDNPQVSDTYSLDNRNPDYQGWPAVKYQIPNDQIITVILRTIFNALGGAEPSNLVELINLKVLRQVQLYPSNVAPILRELRVGLLRSLKVFPLPEGFKRIILYNIEKYFYMLPKIKLGDSKQQEEILCQAKILITLIEAYKGAPLDSELQHKFMDATVLLVRLIITPAIDDDVVTKYPEIDVVVVPEYDEPDYKAPEQPEYNISIDVEVQKYDNQPELLVVQPAYPSIEVEPYPTTEFYQQPYEPEEPEYNVSIDVTMDVERDQPQPIVVVPQLPQEIYIPDEPIEPSYVIPGDYYDETVPTTEDYVPAYQPSEQNITVDVYVDEPQYEPQPQEYIWQPELPEQPDYNFPNEEVWELQTQPSIDVYQPEESQFNVSIEVDIQQEEPQPTVTFYPLPEEPIRPAYNNPEQISIEVTEYELQPEEYYPTEPVDEIPQYPQPNFNVSIGFSVEPDEEDYDNSPKEYEIPEYPAVAYPSVEDGPSYPTIELNIEEEVVADVKTPQEDYYPKNWIDFIPIYRTNPDIQTPSYISIHVSQDIVIPLQSTLQRFVAKSQPLEFLPKAIKIVEAVHRIKIDLKIIIEKVVGSLTGYQPGLSDTVRQVCYYIFPVLPHIQFEDSPIKPNNIQRAIRAVVKVILDSLDNSHPRIVRVFRDVLPKLFVTILLPSTSTPQQTLQRVVPLIKLLQPIWNKLPRTPILSPQKLIPHVYDIIKIVKHLLEVKKNFHGVLPKVPQTSVLYGITQKIFSLIKHDGDCLSKRNLVLIGRGIEDVKSSYPQIPQFARNKIVEQLEELVITLKSSCSNALIHRYVKDFETSLFNHWGVQKDEQLPENFFVQPILKSVRLHDMDESLWGNFDDLLVVLTGPSPSTTTPAILAKIKRLVRRYFKRTIVNTPQNYEVSDVGLRISNLLASILHVPHTVTHQLRGIVIKGLQIVRHVMQGKRETHNLEPSINGIIANFLKIVSYSPVLQQNAQPLVLKLKDSILKTISLYIKQIVEYQKIIRIQVEQIKKRVNQEAVKPVEQLLYRLPPIVKEMTKCSEILPYNSNAYFQQLLSALSGGSVPIDMSYKLVNLVRQIRSQRCASSVPLPGSLGNLETYLPGKSYKKWNVKVAVRKVFTQVAFANSVNARLNEHLLYTAQYLLGVIQPHVVTSQESAGDFVNSIRDWVSTLVYSINQPRENDLLRRSAQKISARFTTLLIPQERHPPQELTNKILELSNAILRWYRAPSSQPLGYYTRTHIQDTVHILSGLNRNVDSSQLQNSLNLLIGHLQGYVVNKDDTLNSPSSFLSSTILDVLGKQLPSQIKNQLIQRVRSLLVVLRNKSSCVNNHSSDNSSRIIQEYINFIQKALRVNCGSDAGQLLQHLLEKASLTIGDTVMKPSVQSIPAPYEFYRAGYVDTCSKETPVVSIPTGAHSLAQLWNLNLITALDNVKKSILLFLDDFGTHELSRNVKEVLDTSLSTVTNDAISHADKLSFSIKLVLRINNGIVVPGNRGTLKSVREIVDLSDLLSGIKNSYGHQKISQRAELLIKELLNKVSGLYGAAPSPQFASSFQHLIVQLLKSRDGYDAQQINPLFDRACQHAQNSWGHVIVPAKRVSLNLGLRNLLVNIIRRIANTAVPISTWQPGLESFKKVVNVIEPATNPQALVDLLIRVVNPIHKSLQCNAPSQIPISRDVSNLLQHLSNVAYEGKVRYDNEQHSVFDYLLNNVNEIACLKNKPQDRPDYIVKDFSKYLYTLQLPANFIKNQLHQLFSVMIQSLQSSREVFLANVRPVVPVLVHNALSSLRIPVHEIKKQRLSKLVENLLESIKHNVFQESQVRTVVNIVNSLLRQPNNDHLHFGLNNAFYQLLRTITGDNVYSRHPKVTTLLRNIRAGLILSAVNEVPLHPAQILISSRLQPQQYPSINKVLHDLNRPLQNRQSHQPEGPLFDALLNAVHEIQKVLVPAKQIQSVLVTKRAVIDYLVPIIENHVPNQVQNTVLMKTVGVIDEFISQLEVHFGNILPKPITNALVGNGIPEGAELSDISPSVLLADFKGPVQKRLHTRSLATRELVLYVNHKCLTNEICRSIARYWKGPEVSGYTKSYVDCDRSRDICRWDNISVDAKPVIAAYITRGPTKKELSRNEVEDIADIKKLVARAF